MYIAIDFIAFYVEKYKKEKENYSVIVNIN